jgi:hypothetical protein
MIVASGKIPFVAIPQNVCKVFVKSAGGGSIEAIVLDFFTSRRIWFVQRAEPALSLDQVREDDDRNYLSV